MCHMFTRLLRDVARLALLTHCHNIKHMSAPHTPLCCASRQRPSPSLCCCRCQHGSCPLLVCRGRFALAPSKLGGASAIDLHTPGATHKLPRYAGVSKRARMQACACQPCRVACHMAFTMTAVATGLGSLLSCNGVASMFGTATAAQHCVLIKEH